MGRASLQLGVRLRRRLLLGGVICTLSGVVAAQPGTDPLPDSLQKRVEAFWQTLSGPQPERSGEYVRDSDRAAYRLRPPLPVAAWRMEGWEFEEPPTAIRVCFLVEMPGSRVPIPVRSCQLWRRLDGQWWLVVPGVTPADANRLLYGTSSRRQADP